MRCLERARVHHFKIYRRTNIVPRDLSYANIMVKDGRVTGIIDWERSGYMPRWWEYVATYRGGSGEDLNWKVMLQDYMEVPDDHKHAAKYWLACRILRDYPRLSQHGKNTLAELETAAGVKAEKTGGR